MLILTRRLGESIMIGEEVTVTLLEARGGQVKLGVNAPKEKAVYREEIYQRIQRGEPRRIPADIDEQIRREIHRR